MSIILHKNSSGSDGNLEKIQITKTQAVTEDVYTDDDVDAIYEAKARILNDALQEIGMGKYQVGYILFNT